MILRKRRGKLFLSLNRAPFRLQMLSRQIRAPPMPVVLRWVQDLHDLGLDDEAIASQLELPRTILRRYLRSTMPLPIRRLLWLIHRISISPDSLLVPGAWVMWS